MSNLQNPKRHFFFFFELVAKELQNNEMQNNEELTEQW